MRSESWQWVEAALDWVFPRRCSLCGLLGPEPICAACFSTFAVADRIRAREPLDAVEAVFAYQGRAAQAVRQLKYSRSTALGPPMASLLEDKLGPLLLGRFVAPVPIHWTRRFARGFNQAEELCAAAPRGVVRTDWLSRARPTRAQAGLNQEARARNLSGAFWASPEVAGKGILLVDDVYTSGHTAAECARTLKAAGATDVVALVFASGWASDES